MKLGPCCYQSPSILICHNGKVTNKYRKYVQNICRLQCICLLGAKFRHKVKSPFEKQGDDCLTASHFQIREPDLSAPVQIHKKTLDILERWMVPGFSSCNICTSKKLRVRHACEITQVFSTLLPLYNKYKNRVVW